MEVRSFQTAQKQQATYGPWILSAVDTNRTEENLTEK
jgi:hypothetical protein